MLENMINFVSFESFLEEVDKFVSIRYTVIEYM